MYALKSREEFPGDVGVMATVTSFHEVERDTVVIC